MLKLQSVLEDDVQVTVRSGIMTKGACTHATCELRIDDATDNEDTGLIASLTADEAAALGIALTQHAVRIRQRDEQLSRVDAITATEETLPITTESPLAEKQAPDGESIVSMATTEEPSDATGW